MNTRHNYKNSEEIELQQKSAELAALRARHADARTVLQRLRDEIVQFESVYDHALGNRIAELESIESEISRLSGYADWEYQKAQSSFAEAWEDTYQNDGQTDSHETPSNPKVQDIKALYREVAKTIHPDLAGAGPAKVLRHELMLKANRAYAEDDRGALQEILRNWRRSPDQAEVEDFGPDLVRVIRLVARERQDIRAVKAKVEDLKASYVCRFKKRVEANKAMGVDLLADMVADAELDIARALKRLARLNGDKPQERFQKVPKETRKLSFPEEICCGTVYLRGRNSISYHNWKRLGPASGCLDVDIDQAVRLDIKSQVEVKLSHMRQIKPNDLQSLFLYEVGDSDLDSIVHLTGLEELYLSGMLLTDDALTRLSSLTNLKRIYLYQTVISDKGLVHLRHLPGLKRLTSSGNGITKEGLAGFQQAFPGMETVSFSWTR